MEQVPLLVIAGPTACGKTAVAVEVAGLVGGEIINADSMQIYRGMDIGTAKPTLEERRRATFHLVDIVDLRQAYSVADFKADALAAARDIAGRGKLPILCGGTGLYVRAVTEGLAFPPRPEDASVRRRLEEELEHLGAEALHGRLAAVDPQSADRIHVNDHKRIVRALEVWELTGQPMSTQQAVDDREALPYNAAKFVLHRPRSALYQAIGVRVDAMLEAGWLEEVSRLAEQGHATTLQSMRALGYRWLLKHLGGELDLGEATRLIKRDTRRFAKRQLTWFRSRPGFTWLLWRDETEIPGLVERLTREGESLMAAGA